MGEKLKIEYVSIDSILPYANNAKEHPQEQVEQIKRSIKDYGMNDPIGVWHNEIVEGHGRLMACKELGITEVPIIRLEHMSDEQRKQYMLVHNQTTMNSDFDLDILSEELDDLLDFDAEFYDFDISLDDEEDLQEIVEDETPEPPEEPITKLGDLWQMGEHRLICGDSTDIAVIDRLMDGVKADMVFTDPPYGMKKESEGVLNDNLNYDDLLDFNRQWIPLTFGALKDNGSWYCWGIDEPLMDIYSEILKPMKKQKGQDKLTFRNLITWDKGNGQGQLDSTKRMYAIADEKCLFVMMGRQTYGETEADYWDGFEPIRTALIAIRDSLGMNTEEVIKYAGATTCSHWFAKSQWEFPAVERYKIFCDNCLSRGRISKAEYDRIREEYDRIREEYDRIREEWYKTRAYFDNTHDNMNDVWHFDRTSQEERKHTGGHATPKPIALCSRAIKSSSREGEIVLDVFGGSGSTLIACEQLNRKCYMAELDPKYCDVIIQRYENLTGKKAVLLND